MTLTGPPPLRRVALLAVGACLAVTTGCGTPSGSPEPLPLPTRSSERPTPTEPHPTVTPTPSPITPSPSPTPSPSARKLPAWLSGAVVTRLPTTRRLVALTFDGGAGAGGANAILDTLGREGVPATFFLTGQFVRSFRSIADRIVSSGYVVGNHTMAHPHLGEGSEANAIRQITRAQDVLTAAGRDPRPWFRFPYGEYDAPLLRLVHDLGYGAIGWTVDTLGWKGHAAGTAGDVVQRVIQHLQPGEIVLMHLGANPNDRTTLDADALPAVIAAIRAAGFAFVDLRMSSPQGVK